MIRPAFVYGLAAMAAVVAAFAEDFPLTFQTIPVKEVMSFPGGAGNYAQLELTKPTKLRTEPRAVSHHALYGEWRDTSTGEAFVFRLDESSGDARGYDRLIVDLNQNGDLTDDPVIPRAPVADDQAERLHDYRFGPIEAPADKQIAGHRPIYFAQA
jgi:hypothetical protein